MKSMRMKDRIAVINGIFNSNIRQIEPDLHKVHAKHCLNAFYGTTTLSGRIEWQNHRNPCGPWNHGVHSIEEFFAACLLLALIVFKVYERLLFHEKISPFITHFICYLYFTGKIYFRREILIKSAFPLSTIAFCQRARPSLFRHSTVS